MGQAKPTGKKFSGPYGWGSPLNLGLYNQQFYGMTASNEAECTPESQWCGLQAWYPSFHDRLRSFPAWKTKKF